MDVRPQENVATKVTEQCCEPDKEWDQRNVNNAEAAAKEKVSVVFSKELLELLHRIGCQATQIVPFSVGSGGQEFVEHRKKAVLAKLDGEFSECSRLFFFGELWAFSKKRGMGRR